VRYGQDGAGLPLPTSLAISVRLIMVVIPMAWTLLSYFIFKLVKNRRIEQRVETLLAFTVVTLVIGLFILLFFTLSGILPFLDIGRIPG
jgi:pilus assembly protein TadC